MYLQLLVGFWAVELVAKKINIILKILHMHIEDPETQNACSNSVLEQIAIKP